VQTLGATADKKLPYSKAVTPDIPLFMYFAPGAANALHHACKEWSEKFKRKFDRGVPIFAILKNEELVR
jgi:arylsulfatase A-like enzyme